jgi:cation transporter family protein
MDNKLSWNESDYGGLAEIRLPHDKVWKPDIILYNNADALASLSQIHTQLIITSNGNVTWLSTNIYKSSCSINVQMFPFDVQNCSLAFASWTYDGTAINLLKNSESGDISNYIENGEWSLENLLVERNVRIYSCCPQPYPNVTYYIVLKRRPLFYVFNMIMPSILITLVGFLIFLIPPDSGEKVGMGVTTLLSMTVFLMVVAENMPPNSDSVPLIAIYYFSSMLMISLATVAAVFTINVCRKGDEEKPVPELLRKIFFDIIAKLLFVKINKDNRDLNLTVKEAFPDENNNHSNMTKKFIYSNDEEVLMMKKPNLMEDYEDCIFMNHINNNLIHMQNNLKVIEKGNLIFCF